MPSLSLTKNAYRLIHRLRRSVAPAAKPDPVTGPSPQAEARRLLAMLEGQPEGLAEVARSRELRAVAAELVRRVEKERAGASVPRRAPRAAQAKPVRATPLHATAPAPVRARVSEVPRRPAAPKAVQVQPTRARRASSATPEPRVPLGVVKTLARGVLRGGTMRAEHPAVLALALMDRPRREQALALRAMVGAQARAVHRLMTA